MCVVNSRDSKRIRHLEMLYVCMLYKKRNSTRSLHFVFICGRLWRACTAFPRNHLSANFVLSFDVTLFDYIGIFAGCLYFQQMFKTE